MGIRGLALAALATSACYVGLSPERLSPCASDPDACADGGETSSGETTLGDTGADTASSDPSGVDTTPATSSDDTTTAPNDTGESSGPTTGPTECDVEDPDVVVPPGPGDLPGDPCCSDQNSCDGKDVDGSPAQESDVGDLLQCIGGVWTISEQDCIDTCGENGNTYLGCFWDSYYGLNSPICGCQ